MHNSGDLIQPAGPGRGEPFFFGMGILLLAINLVAFGVLAIRLPELTPPVSIIVVLHALTSFGWLALFIFQARQIQTRNLGLHRQLGQWSAVLAGGFVVTAAVISLSAVQRTGTFDNLAFQLFSLIDFTLFFLLAITFRKARHQHKRFMLLASIAILAPATARISLLLNISDVLVPLTQLALLLSIVAYDLIKFKHIKLATVFGFVWFFISVPLALLLRQNEHFIQWVTNFAAQG